MAPAKVTTLEHREQGEPPPAPNCPRAQGRQAATDVPPGVLACVPPGQGVQDDAPCIEA